MRTLLSARLRRWTCTAALWALATAASAAERELKVCADPNNLPFSDARLQGFENRIIEIIARELDATPSYTWWAQRRGAVRETLKQGLCDVIPGVATGLATLATTRPYYRSTYVFVTRADRALALEGLDDERLRSLRLACR